MPLLTKIIEFLKGLLKAKGLKQLNPSRDWLTLLSCCVIALLISMGWNAWFFFKVLNQQQPIEVSADTKPTDTSALEKAQALFETRATEEARYKSEYRFIDPSR